MFLPLKGILEIFFGHYSMIQITVQLLTILIQFWNLERRLPHVLKVFFGKSIILLVIFKIRDLKWTEHGKQLMEIKINVEVKILYQTFSVGLYFRKATNKYKTYISDYGM